MNVPKFMPNNKVTISLNYIYIYILLSPIYIFNFITFNNISILYIMLKIFIFNYLYTSFQKHAIG